MLLQQGKRRPDSSGQVQLNFQQDNLSGLFILHGIHRVQLEFHAVFYYEPFIAGDSLDDSGGWAVLLWNVPHIKLRARQRN